MDICDFLANRRQAVVVNGERSDFLSVQSGVPQGSVLGPCLFLIYINDLPDTLTVPVRLFADDTVLYSQVNSSRDQLHLQNNLDKLAEWGEKWDMKFNASKCTVLTVSRKRKILQQNYQLYDNTLEAVNTAKYLGITISSDLNWKPHIEDICVKANRTLGFLRRNLKISSRKVKEAAYKSYVRPILEYAVTVWDTHTQEAITKLEAVQRRAARFVMRRYRNTSSVSAMIHDLHWASLEERRRIARLTILFKIQHNLICLDSLKTKLHPLPPRRRRGHSHQLTIPHCHTKHQQNAFLIHTIKDWNGLPIDAVEAKTIDTFVSLVKRQH